MKDAQFVFVTEDARVMAMTADGRLEDVTDVCELLPQTSDRNCKDVLLEKKRALMLKFAA